MKKILCMSGTFTILLLSLILTGWADEDDAVKKALRQGNKSYESAAYNDALKTYEEGLLKSPENILLNYNAAQAAYLSLEYEKAIEYYNKSEDSIEKFLNAGNIYFTAGEMASEDEQKAQHYVKALQIYQEGIIKFPQDVALKYNYEVVKEKVEEYQENEEQESEEEEGGQESQDDGEDSEESEGSQDDGEDSEESEGSQGDGEDSEESESSQGDGEDSEESESSQGDSGDGEESESSKGSGEDGEDSGENEGGKSEGNEVEGGNEAVQSEGEYEADQEAIERILKMLESQEEQSLKNNQEVVGGNDGKNGW